MTPTFAAAVALACLLRIASAGVVPTSDPGGGFEIEGDLEANTPTANTTDWVPGPPGLGEGVLASTGAPVDPSRTFHLLDPYDATDDVFSALPAKPMNADPNTWIWTNTPIVSSRNFNHALVHLPRDAAGHRWLIVALDRLAVNSTTFIGVELLQTALFQNGDGTFSTAGPSSGRTVGDILIQFGLSGAFLDLSVARWTEVSPGVFNFATVSLPASSLDGTNAAPINVPYGAFGATSYQAYQLGEIAVDLTVLLGGSPATFATLFIHDEASQSFGSSLTDFFTPLQLGLSVTGVEEPLAPGLALRALTPNPAHGLVELEYSLPVAAALRLDVLDVAGRQVARLADGVSPAGRHRATWRANAHVASGVYLVRYQATGQTILRRVTLLR